MDTTLPTMPQQLRHGEDKITISFFIPGLPPSPNSQKGLHWTKLAKVKKEWTHKVAIIAYEAKQKEGLRGLYDKSSIQFHISLGDNRRRDPDNLIWSICKPSLDGLTGVLIKDDDIDSVTLSFSFDRKKPKGFRVTLTGL